LDAKKAHVAACGWSTYGGIVATTADEDLDLGEIKALLKRVEREIDTAPNRVRYTMNGFVIAVISGLPSLFPVELDAGRGHQDPPTTGAEVGRNPEHRDHPLLMP
jgi:hypothetical protein